MGRVFRARPFRGNGIRPVRVDQGPVFPCHQRSGPVDEIPHLSAKCVVRLPASSDGGVPKDRCGELALGGASGEAVEHLERPRVEQIGLVGSGWRPPVAHPKGKRGARGRRPRCAKLRPVRHPLESDRQTDRRRKDDPRYIAARSACWIGSPVGDPLRRRTVSCGQRGPKSRSDPRALPARPLNGIRQARVSQPPKRRS